MKGKHVLHALESVDDRFIAEMYDSGLTQKRHIVHRSTKKVWLIAVIAGLTLLLVGCTIAYAYGWLTGFFNTQSNGTLSSEQIDFITEKEQTIGESQTHDKWTVQLKSAINDGRTAYIILGITAPKNIDLESPGTTDYYLSGEFAELISNNRQIEILSEESGWELDDDGLINTLDYIICLECIDEDETPEPYGSEVEWNIHIENILCQSMDSEYYQELLNGKYKGQDDIELTDEEIDRLYHQDIVAEGVWDFTFTFEQSNSGLELVSVPITVKAYASRNANEKSPSYEDVIITRFTLNSFSVEISHDADALVTFTNPNKEKVVVVMRDGSEIELRQDSATREITILNSFVPIIPSEVDHIRMPDGTILTTTQ